MLRLYVRMFGCCLLIVLCCRSIYAHSGISEKQLNTNVLALTTSELALSRRRTLLSTEEEAAMRLASLNARKKKKKKTEVCVSMSRCVLYVCVCVCARARVSVCACMCVSVLRSLYFAGSVQAHATEKKSDT